ncbi:MAG TPA: hypothetical protein VEV17_07595 [Bryobacteraceae bacterium]|nr:hypothetical protein [Bryobacteraceae bacterium]
MRVGSVYGVLLSLYPRDYREWFSREMRTAFEKASEEHRAQGRAAYAGLVLAEFGGLLFGAAAEWIAKWTTNSSLRGRTLPDLRNMRPVGVPRDVWFAGAGADAPPDELLEAEKRTEFLVSRIVHAIASHDFEGARSYSFEESQARENLRQLHERYGIGE